MGIYLLLALKIIAFVILGILAVAMLILLVVLFVPLRYRIYGQKYGQISGKATVSWLFGALRFVLEADGNGETNTGIIVFGIRLRQKKSDEAESCGKPPPTPEPLQKDGAAEPESVPAARKEAPHTLERTAKAEKTVRRQESAPKAEKHAKKRKEEKKRKKTGEGSAFETLKDIWALENKAEIINQCLLLIKRVLKIVFNMRIWADLKFGTGSPDTTGYLLGLCWAASSLAGVRINAEGDFEQESLSGRAEAKGGIFICALIWVIILFVLNKSIFRLIKKYVLKKG